MQGKALEPRVLLYEEWNDAVDKAREFVRAYVNESPNSSKVGKVLTSKNSLDVDEIVKNLKFNGFVRFGQCWIRISEAHVNPRKVLPSIFRGLLEILQ
jgi:hypothetical protein